MGPSVERVSPAAADPSRRAGSVRRTSTIDMTWPSGALGPMEMHGRARDLHTSVTGAAAVCDLASVQVTLDPARVVTAARVSTPDVDVTPLLGGSVGSGFRRRLAATLPADHAAGTALHLLLDDLVGAAIVSDFALRQWQVFGLTPRAASPRRVVGLCTGFTEGSTALHPDGTSTGVHRTLAVPSVADVGDPLGWHDAPEPPGMSMRRARRIDVWTDDGRVGVDAMFQDSCTDPSGGRRAVHEYRITAAADAAGTIETLTATPRTLPYHECPFATAGLGRLVGTALGGLRTGVPSTLRGTAGCTHLNDAVRGLADVPALLRSGG